MSGNSSSHDNNNNDSTRSSSGTNVYSRENDNGGTTSTTSIFGNTQCMKVGDTGDGDSQVTSSTGRCPQNACNKLILHHGNSVTAGSVMKNYIGSKRCGSLSDESILSVNKVMVNGRVHSQDVNRHTETASNGTDNETVQRLKNDSFVITPKVDNVSNINSLMKLSLPVVGAVSNDSRGNGLLSGSNNRGIALTPSGICPALSQHNSPTSKAVASSSRSPVFNVQVKTVAADGSVVSRKGTVAKLVTSHPAVIGRLI